MKKTIIKSGIIGIALLMLLYASGCGNQSQNGNSSSNDDDSAFVIKISTDKTPTTSKNKEIKQISLNEKITTDILEMTIEEIGEAKKIQSTDISYWKTEDGETFFYAKGTIKNTYKEAFERFSIPGEIIADDKYTYSIRINFAGSVGMTKLEPLKSSTFYLMAEFPDELINTYKECKIRFGFDEELTPFISLDNADYLFELDYKK